MDFEPRLESWWSGIFSDSLQSVEGLEDSVELPLPIINGTWIRRHYLRRRNAKAAVPETARLEETMVDNRNFFPSAPTKDISIVNFAKANPIVIIPAMNDSSQAATCESHLERH